MYLERKKYFKKTNPTMRTKYEFQNHKNNR